MRFKGVEVWLRPIERGEMQRRVGDIEVASARRRPHVKTLRVRFPFIRRGLCFVLRDIHPVRRAGSF